MIKRNIIVKSKKYSSPMKNYLSELLTSKKVEEDYFRDRGICYLGVRNDIFNSYQWNKALYQNPFDDPNYKFSSDDYVFFNINPNRFMNMRMLATSGLGKTQLIKNIISDLQKSGEYNILIINAKNPEFVTAKNKGNTTRLHPYSKNESLKVANYCATHVKDYADLKQFDLSGMKYYSNKINTFTERESWLALGLTPISAAFCSNLVKSGCKSLKDILRALLKSDLNPSTRRSAIDKIEIAMDEGLFGRHKPLDFNKEWGENENIVILNYYQKFGYVTSTDIVLSVERARDYVLKTKGTAKYKKTIIIFDDAPKYASDRDYNEAAVQLIINCQTMYRVDGIDNIVVYQSFSSVHKDIATGSDETLISFITDTESIGKIVSSDVVNIIKSSSEYGGLVLDNDSYTKEWIYIPPQSREFYRFIPQGCKIGHDFN